MFLNILFQSIELIFKNEYLNKSYKLGYSMIILSTSYYFFVIKGLNDKERILK